MTNHKKVIPIEIQAKSFKFLGKSGWIGILTSLSVQLSQIMAAPIRTKNLNLSRIDQGMPGRPEFVF